MSEMALESPVWLAKPGLGDGVAIRRGDLDTQISQLFHFYRGNKTAIDSSWVSDLQHFNQLFYYFNNLFLRRAVYDLPGIERWGNQIALRSVIISLKYQTTVFIFTHASKYDLRFYYVFLILFEWNQIFLEIFSLELDHAEMFSLVNKLWASIFIINDVISREKVGDAYLWRFIW